ncbi:ELMO domain-containing protein [Aureococcus anophagefferens]|nr:ELMO domain-containing protein [Aureococcus anophagefferens]
MGGRGAPREASADEARVLAAVEGELNRSFDEARASTPACAGINVTLALCEFAGLRGPGGAPKPAARPELSFWPLLAGDGAAWDAAYAVGFRLLDRSFDSKRASYMDFNAVRKEAVADLRAALERGRRRPAAARARGPWTRAPCGHDGLAKGPAGPHGWGATAPARAALEKLPVSGLPVGDRPGVQASPAAAKADAAAWAKAEVHGELTNATLLTADSGIRPRDATAFKWDLPPGWASSSSGWAARVDARSGHTYYFFPPTGETTWTLPER